MVNGVFDFEDKIWNGTILSKKYLVNKLLILGFANKKTIRYQGAKYKDVVGFSMDSNKHLVEIKHSDNTIFKIPVYDYDKVIIRKEGFIIDIKVY